MKKLPIGIQSFEKLIQSDCYYVDKTPFIAQLTQSGSYYFLSRPRRFGKSLFLSTIKAAYQGKKDLFHGLHLFRHWDWGTSHPVVHISFGSGVIRDLQELQTTFSEILYDHGREHDIQYAKESLKGRFAELISKLYEAAGQRVVVLVDEYDKPILDNIEHIETAKTIREELKNYYSVIKEADPYIAFAFITGVSKFSKVSLFSGLNNLQDITLDKRYSALCGYTQDELEFVFADRMLDVDLDQVRKWYNGYSWLGENVYNPFDVLLYLESKVFANYWFETGTPSFLIRLAHARQLSIPDLEHLQASEQLLGSFDIDQIEPETLLFQTGYLTIKGMETLFDQEILYSLGYPNHEVKKSFHRSVLHWYTQSPHIQSQKSIYQALTKRNLEQLKTAFHALFASIPSDWYRKNQLAGYEGYYASVVYAYFAALGLDVHPEEPSNKGRMDLVLKLENCVYIIEFKVVELSSQSKALSQIKAKGYAQKFGGQEVYLIGVEFSSQERNIVGFEWEQA